GGLRLVFLDIRTYFGWDSFGKKIFLDRSDRILQDLQDFLFFLFFLFCSCSSCLFLEKTGIGDRDQGGLRLVFWT
ncbi:MAG: hypothetical protein IJP59_02430, partial [Muribaculaceae bacterium]|nr:hypothetical protein [Muribaculaceae bacterium]